MVSYLVCRVPVIEILETTVPLPMFLTISFVSMAATVRCIASFISVPIMFAITTTIYSIFALDGNKDFVVQTSVTDIRTFSPACKESVMSCIVLPCLRL